MFGDSCFVTRSPALRAGMVGPALLIRADAGFVTFPGLRVNPCSHRHGSIVVGRAHPTKALPMPNGRCADRISKALRPGRWTIAADPGSSVRWTGK